MGRIARNRGSTVAIVKAVYGVRLTVPSWIVVDLPGVWIAHRVAVCRVGEHVAGVVGDDIEDHVNAVLMGEVDKGAEVLARTEVRIDVEKILDPVSVVARWLECDLAEDRAYPQRRDAKAFEIAELARESFQRPTLPRTASIEPATVINPSCIFAIEPRRPFGYRTTIVVPIAAALVAVGESIDQQKIQHLVLPSGRGGTELPLAQPHEVEIQQTLLNVLGHGRSRLNSLRFRQSSGLQATRHQPMRHPHPAGSSAHARWRA